MTLPYHLINEMTLPEDFILYTKDLMGNKLFEELLQGLQETDPITSIRLNPFKLGQDKTFIIPDKTENVPWCKSGLYLNDRPNFTFDPLLHAGVYYAQEASSMFLEQVIRQVVTQPVTMLDLCAAPGGKSTVARSVLPAGSLLFANEPIHTRSNILAENIMKFGHPDVIVTNNYPQDYKKSKLLFDVILADVPCSGEGMFRKDENAITEWSLQNVEKCRLLQRDIIKDIWDNLKYNGILIYSTCTFNAKENEENVEWITKELGAEYIDISIDKNWKITPSLINNHPVYRFIPGKTKGEGLFMAVLRKTSGEMNTDSNRETKIRNKNKKKIQTIPTYPDYLQHADQYEFITDREQEIAIPKLWYPIYAKTRNSLKILQAGITLGTTKGKALIPDQSLALSIVLNRNHFPNIEMNYDEAIAYLRKEPVTLPSNSPKGFTLLTYHNIPLGWEKNIGNRANNLYPQEWKIKSSHIPEGNNNVIVFN